MPALTVTTFQIPLVALVEPQGITTGPDGNLWFTENGAGKIGRMTPSGVVMLWFMGSSGGDGDGCLCSGLINPIMGIFGQITSHGSIHVSKWLEEPVEGTSG
jgi:hypothetical protein